MIRLGLRLALAGGPVRITALLLGGALSVLILSLAWAMPDALYPVIEIPGEEPITPSERGTAEAMSAMLLAPVLLLLVVAGRLSSTVRDQRLTSLRLIGINRARTLVAAVVENVSLTAVGALAGVGVAYAAAWLINVRVQLAEPVAFSPGRMAVVLGAVVVFSGVLALASLRTLQLLPTQARRGGVVKPASWWRAVPFVAAVACFGLAIFSQEITELALRLRPEISVDEARGFRVAAVAGLFRAGIVLGALGIVTTPALIARYVARALRRSRRFPLLMAGRSIEADPASATRRVAGVGIALFALGIGAGVLTAFETVPQSVYATRNAERGPQEVSVHAGWDMEADQEQPLTAGDLAELENIPGAERVIPVHEYMASTCDVMTSEGCLEIFSGSCADLAVYYVSVAGCSDERAAWIGSLQSWDVVTESFDGVPESLEVVARSADGETEGAATTIDLSGPEIETDERAVVTQRGFLPYFHVFVPPHLVEEIGAAVHRADVIGPPGREFAVTVGSAAEALGLHSDSPMRYSDYDLLLSVRSMVGGTGAALVAVVLVAVSLSIMDWLRESRRPRMRMLAIGVPRRTIGLSYLIQFSLPLVGALLAGGTLALLGVRTYEVLGGDESLRAFSIPPVFWWLGLLLAGGVATVAVIAALTAREPMRAQDLRTE
ncbi:FtsX-like permease family protein [Bogoriella caseilytica]|uniref:FtsX-like permease family protein n=1 Tax=Bogoriella caseilytica TaxID=56055 RepID=A0A3N2BF23_9MICO|nr:FtsX-like permease family protein [Bogoriella caseilytica]ROR73863.1 FtsX-like permease family protein [Bogoriella caseilytica]